MNKQDKEIRELAENLIKYIKECVNKDGCYYEGTDTELCDLADELATSVLDTMDWVSVRERLPEEKAEVLIYCLLMDNKTGKQDGDGIITTGALFKRKGGNLWAIGEDSAFEYDPKYIKVTHWKPLPEPPHE